MNQVLTTTVVPSRLASETGSLWELGLSLLLVLALVLAVAWLVKRTQRLTGWQSVIQVKSSLVLGAHERLLIVEVEGRRLFLGVTPQAITFLTELAGGTEPAVAATEPPDFSHYLKNMIRGIKR